MRVIIYSLCALYALICGFVWWDGNNGGSDAAGNAMAQGFASIIIANLLLCAIPAALLAAIGTAPRFALTLALLPVVLVLLFLIAGGAF